METAFCKTLGISVNTANAKLLFFAQPSSARMRFIFQCDDSHCRQSFPNSIVVGVNYDKHDGDSDATLKFTSPYFKSLNNHPHIESCNWLQGESASSHHRIQETQARRTRAQLIDDLGLVFNLLDTPVQSTHSVHNLALDADISNAHKFNNNKSQNPAQKPANTSLMDVVCAEYLRMTEHQRKSTHLGLGALFQGTFYSVCVPIFGFHPAHLGKRIYFGNVKVTSLSNVFYLNFVDRINPEGDKTKRHFQSQIKLVKSFVKEQNHSLLIALEQMCVQKNDAIARCFFYSNIPVTETKFGTFEFSVTNLKYLAVVPVID